MTALRPADSVACGCGGLRWIGSVRCVTCERTRRRDRAAAGAEERFWTKVDRSGECWVWTAGTTPSGYGSFSVAGEHWMAHRFAWVITNGAIADGLWVLHSCDMQDMTRKGRHARAGGFRRGEEQWSAKLGDDAVRIIRRLYPEFKSPALARAFHVSEVTILAVVHGEKWTHVA